MTSETNTYGALPTKGSSLPDSDLTTTREDQGNGFERLSIAIGGFVENELAPCAPDLGIASSPPVPSFQL